jgi:putative protein kinase ArgK-like GTPase of G3E family
MKPMRKFLKIDPRLRIEDLDEVMSVPEIIRVNDFDEEALEDFEEALDDAHATGQSVIPIVIDSYGGSAYGVLGMIAAVEHARRFPHPTRRGHLRRKRVRNSRRDTVQRATRRRIECAISVVI